MKFFKKFQVMWSDMDPNIHMRHSAYNDYAAQTRLLFLSEHGFGMDWFKKHNVYPVLFREETIFLAEVKGNETITIDVVLQKMSKDGKKWSMTNHFYKEDGKPAARLTVDGAWMDLEIRKLKAPPESLFQIMDKLDHAADFEWIPKKEKSK